MTVVRRLLGRVRGRDDEAGFTLIEMLTVMVLGAIIGVAVTSAMISGLRSQTRVDAHQTSLEQTRVAMQRVTREVRNAGPKGVLSAYDNEIVVAQDRGSNAYRTMDFKITTSAGIRTLVLVETDYSGSGCSIASTTASTCVASAPRTTTVLPSIANDSTTPLFAYTPWTGYTPKSSAVTASTCVWSGYSPTRYAPECPGKVTIHLMQLISGAPSNRPTDLSDTVELRNQGS